jgi:hypothetical protein
MASIGIGQIEPNTIPAAKPMTGGRSGVFISPDEPFRKSPAKVFVEASR